MPEFSDERLEQLLLGLQGNPQGGFANWFIMRDELRAALTDLRRYREKPLHCPGCDGDHL